MDFLANYFDGSFSARQLKTPYLNITAGMLPATSVCGIGHFVTIWPEDMLEKVKNTARASAQTSYSAAAEDDEIDLIEIFTALWRGKWIILAAGVLLTVLGAYYAFRVAVPKYTSTASVVLQVNAEPFVDIESVVSGVSSETSSLNTEIQVIRSRGLIEKLVKQLDLTADPEFNRALIPQSKYSISNLKKQISSLMGSPSKNDGPDLDAQFTSTVTETRSAITASILRSTYVFEISATTTNTAKSQLIANTLANLYIQDQIDTKFLATEKAVTWLSEKVTELEIELRKQEENLKSLRSNTDLIGEEALQALNRQLIDVRDRLVETQADLVLSEARLAKITELQESGDKSSLVNLLGDPSLRQIFNRLTDGSDATEKLFEDRLALLTTRAQNEKLRLEQQIATLSGAVDRQQKSIELQSRDLVELQELERELEATKILYQTFLTRLKETTVQRGLQNADSRVLSEALLGRYVEPKKSLILMLSAVLGLMSGAGFVLFKQFVHSGFRTAEELEEHTGLPILGQIPKMEITRRDQLIDYLNTKSTSAASEAIRNLRTSVLLSDIDTPPQVIMSTSSVPGEGKTTQAISLAHNLSGMGRKVLLVEGDIRRRTFNEYFDGSGKRGGVLTAMTGDAPIEDLIIRDSRMNVDILMGEKSTANAADVFSSAKFKEFIRNAREQYDVVIIDTPPVLVVPDARVIGQSVDAIVFTVAWDRTTKSQITESIRQFATANLSLTGLVLSQVDPKGMRRYGYGGRYGAYAAYGEGYYDT